MGSFISGLAKGFVRSAVNQVGRDAGRVVSNNIYGDAHSIPHRNVSAGGAGRVSSVGKVENEGIQPIVPSVGAAWFWGFVGFVFSIIGGVVLLIVGYRKLKINIPPMDGYMNRRLYMSLIIDTREGNGTMVINHLGVR